MELNPDVLRMLALELDLPSIIKFCKTNRLVKKSVCENNTFWRTKLYRDYPNSLTDVPAGTNFEKIYKTVAANQGWSYYYVLKYPKEKGKLPQMFPLLGKQYLDFPADMRKKVRQILIKGVYPKGTKLWGHYSDSALFDEGNFGVAATREKAINDLINSVKRGIDPNNYWQKGAIRNRSFEEWYGLSAEELRSCLDNNSACQITRPNGQHLDFIVQEFTIP